ncbi:MAG: fibronectin type III domain-containing protein [Patescibacteria group bacterium]|nr:fibronectin type III domain-containing protein [Patescibacteria group bacterium]
MPEEQMKQNTAPAAEPEIIVIPEKFYGAALKAKAPEMARMPDQALEKPKKSHVLPIIIVVVILLLGAAGAFVYLNQDLFFPKPAPAPQPVVVAPPEPIPVPPPAAPQNFSATSTNPQSVAISWTDSSDNEAGFRLERAEGAGPFFGLTNLPSNSSSFLDVSVKSDTTYRYRMFASNQSGDSAPSSESTVQVPPLPPAPPEQQKLPPAGLDSDSDGLTDLEEEFFKTSKNSPDTDSDGFLDGNEVFHLYNPNGQAPARLIDAGLVKELKGSVGWEMQVPSTWTMNMDKADGTAATLDSGHGETFILTIQDNPSRLSVIDWYLEKNPDVQRNEILAFRSKQGYEGIIGKDLLTTYIPWEDKIFVFKYDIDGQQFINYRTTYSMMLNSLILRGMPQIAPPIAGAPLPFEPAATTTGVVNQPQTIDVFPSPGGGSSGNGGVTETGIPSAPVTEGNITP